MLDGTSLFWSSSLKFDIDQGPASLEFAEIFSYEQNFTELGPAKICFRKGPKNWKKIDYAFIDARKYFLSRLRCTFEGNCITNSGSYLTNLFNSIVLAGQKKASEDHRMRSKLLHHCFWGRHTTSFLLRVPRFFFYHGVATSEFFGPD